MRLWDVYYTVTSVDDAIALLSDYGDRAKIMAGGTDLIVELQHADRQVGGPLLSTPSPNLAETEHGAGRDNEHKVMIDITRVGGLGCIQLADEGPHTDGLIHLGPMVTHAQAAASSLVQEHGLPLAQSCWGVGAPALRNRGTIAGNLVTASPANDTITALRALDAQVTLRSTRGQRVISLADFYRGVRRTVMSPDELLVDIAFAPLSSPPGRGSASGGSLAAAREGRTHGIFLKIGLRRVMAIAVTNVAVVVGQDDQGMVTEARIALGSVAPTIVRAGEAETALIGGLLTDDRIAVAAGLAVRAARPIGDVRGSAWFRGEEVTALVRRALECLRDGSLRLGLPAPGQMVKLWGKTRRWPRLSGPTVAHRTDGEEPIQTVVNGENVTVEGANGKTLLKMLREDLGLTGTKVGCEEGECGACTVWLDGIATLACLTPAPRAHGARVETVEGLSASLEEPEAESESVISTEALPPSEAPPSSQALHPVQQAFIDEDAVQCGYCTPGFVMSAAKLLEEFPHPDRAQIKTALSGNLCRCTGYYKIVAAVEKAAGGHAL
jgi:xanthine dehydrogenase iron-sulfur cluster and FAD-binding subunit A